MTITRQIWRVGGLGVALGSGAMILSPFALADSGDGESSAVASNCHEPLCTLMIGEPGVPAKSAVTGPTAWAAPGLDPVWAWIGVFIGNGVDAADDCTGVACNGGNGGLLF